MDVAWEGDRVFSLDRTGAVSVWTLLPNKFLALATNFSDGNVEMPCTKRRCRTHCPSSTSIPRSPLHSPESPSEVCHSYGGGNLLLRVPHFLISLADTRNVNSLFLSDYAQTRSSRLNRCPWGRPLERRYHKRGLGLGGIEEEMHTR